MRDPSFESLATPRLRIRRFRLADAESLAAYRSDPEVARLQAWESCTPDEARRFIESLRDCDPGTPGRWFQFAVELEGSARLIGDCALRCPQREPRQGELGFTFARAHQGRGYAAEALRALLAYAFERLALHRVFSITDVRNARACRLLERVGFRREAHFREAAWFKGVWASEYLYARLAAEAAQAAPASGRH
jgi:RimJ/RimL family protein N-acetyltransferase